MPEWLGKQAALSPNRPALISAHDRWTFAELDTQVSSVAQRLRGSGIDVGGRVALLANNSSGFVQLVHAATRLGGAVVPLNVRLTAPELSEQLRDVGATLLVVDQANAAKAEAFRDALSDVKTASLETLTRASAGGQDSEAEAEGRLIDLSSVHSVIYTSGTSGRPKGAMLTLGNHFWSAIGSALNLGLRDDDRWLACLPLFHVGGLAILMRSVIYGIPVVVHDGFDPVAVNDAIDNDGVTMVSMVSQMLERTLEARGDRPYPPSFRCALVGGGPVHRSLLEECVRRGVPTVQTYGLTEAASQVTTLAPGDALRKLGSAGKPLFPTEIRIESEGGGACGPGESGEIAVRGATVTPGYVNRPEETRALRDGWLHTGDIGHLDGDGYLYVLDRRDDLIVSGGENVYPGEVESALRRHPDVLDAGVVGLPDERWGRTAVATVVLRPGAAVSEDDLRAFCREELASYKLPARLRFAEELPRNAAGKLLRSALREQWSGGKQE